MKRAVSISLGSSKRDKAVEVELLGERVRIERIGTDGDMAKAQRMFAELDALFASKSMDEWLALFGDSEVCVGPALTLPEALELHADRVFTLDQPGEGSLRQLGGLFGVTLALPAPALGEHTEATLAVLGKSAEEIAALQEAGVV